MLTVKDLPKILEVDGRKITDEADWRVRREEIKKLLQSEEYGFLPPIVPCRVESEKVTSHACAGKGYWERLTFTLENGGKTFSYPAQLIYPLERSGPIPFFVFMNFTPNVPDRYYPTEELVDRGVGVLTIHYNDVSIDENTFGAGLEKLFLEGERGEHTFGKIALWAYAMHRAVDYLVTRPEVDPGKIIAIGHSRLGKTALLATALDERIAMVICNNSGSSGAAIARQKSGETIFKICRDYPHWFCKKYQTYADREDELPFDQHHLAALVAPRVLAILTAAQDPYADSHNQYLTSVAVNEVYEGIYGKQGCVSEDETFVPEKLYDEGFSIYRERAGTHFLSRADWNLAVDLIRKL